MKISLENSPLYIPLSYLPYEKGERSFLVMSDIEVILSDGRIITIPKGTKTDLSSVPKWAWSVFSPIDRAFIADLIHDYLWINKKSEIEHFCSIHKARKFADNERNIWRKKIAPKKKFKNLITHLVIRAIGSFYYSEQMKIPN